MNVGLPNQDKATNPPLAGFLKSLCRYYSDFLETDFHASRTPSRQINSHTKQGFRASIDLSAFPSFSKAAFRALLQRFDGAGLPEISARADAMELQPELDERPGLYATVFELYKNSELLDKFGTYLYFCPMTYEERTYPLFFLPLAISLSDTHDVFSFDQGPVLYVNHRAIQHVTQSVSENRGARWSFDLPDRQLYLASFSDRELYSELQRIINSLCDFSGGRAVDLSQVGASSSAGGLQIDISAYLAIAPQGDEALLTDYEHLLALLQTNPDDPSVLGMLSVLKHYLFENPESFETEIDNELQAEEMTARLNYPSPIPLNFEQLAVSRALRKADCKRLVIEGPPGTGKSHTITGLIFEALRDGKSVLLVSDKKEALDVVEDKINQVLDAVAVDDSFQNPILRLGDKDNNFQKIFYEGNLTKIRERQRALSTREALYETEVGEIRAHVARQADEAIDATISLHSNAAASAYKFEHQHSGLLGAFDVSEYGGQPETKFRALWKSTRDFTSAYQRLSHLKGIASIKSVDALIETLQMLATELINLQHLTAEPCSRLFLDDVSADNLGFLETLPARAHDLKKPIVGFLFARHALESLTLESKAHFPRGMYSSWSAIIATVPTEANRYRRAIAMQKALEPLEIDPLDALRDPSLISSLLEPIQTLARYCNLLASTVLSVAVTANNLGVNLENAPAIATSTLAGLSNDRIDELYKYWNTAKELEEDSKQLSTGDYLSQRGEIENRLTLQMSSLLDKSVLRFSKSHNNEAQDIRRLIKGRKQIARSLLGPLVQAFPCIIIGIRELGAYIPFEHELFDIVIIDEASQVSIAQALPAILRGRQAVVLGDPKQYSNVKAAFASTELNTSAFSRVREAFSRDLGDMSRDEQRRFLEKLGNFNVKSSILDFVRNVANYKAFLRKHFRGYAELIHFSNETFYANQLQVMKIRSRPLAEVIAFHELPESLPDEKLNINVSEADFILARLEAMAADGFSGSVGVITPFTDQQRYIAARCFESPHYKHFRSNLRLKIMTFDTCQGEERDVLLYSMVERHGENALSYIFPASLTQRGLDDEGNLRLQRLNVGLTRARETVQFVVSKPLSAFRGAIGEALRFFQAESQKPDFASLVAGTDPRSRMEPKVLQMISQTAIYREAGDRLNIFPQFPIGEMLRRLDPYARVPKYKVDFLVTYRSEDGSLQKVIVEYDGAEYHFEDPEFLNEFTYDRLRATSDIERMRIIESYGYPIISLNKFLLRRHPIETIDRLLREALKKRNRVRQTDNNAV